MRFMKKKMKTYSAPIGTNYVEGVKGAIEFAKKENETIKFVFNGHEFLIAPTSRVLDVVALIDAMRYTCVKHICGD